MNVMVKRTLRWIGLIAALGVAFRLGMAFRHKPAPPPAKEAQAGQAPEVQEWTCSMHPQIRQPKPGRCPICGMSLIPVPQPTSEAARPREFVTTVEAARLMEIETAPVERKYVATELRMVGKVDYDETRLAYLTAWVAGRLDRLYVDYTGATVRKGDHLVDIYSPDLVVAQGELLQALRAAREAEGEPGIEQLAAATLGAAREKLRLLGLKPEQVTEIENRGTPAEHVTLYAPIGGVVIRREGRVGMYVQTGTPIYAIADLSNVWVKLDAYESDLPWLRYGQKAVVTAEAYPGEKFTGTISFIEPVLNAATRTVKLRVNVPNPDGKLKPEMFVRAVVQAQVAEGGRVMEPSLAGMWICPMHPEVIKPAAGNCDVCGMPLVTTESLGYAAAAASAGREPLVIPASAPLITGPRAVVYVEVTGREKPTYEGREVELGPRAGDYYIVKSGLTEGERVVTRGNFKIDSALQIQAKPSMMRPEGGGPPAVHHHGGAPQPAGTTATSAAAPAEESPDEAVPEAFRQQLGSVVRAYLDLASALASDDEKGAGKAFQAVQQALEKIDTALLRGRAHGLWMEAADKMQKAIGTAAKGWTLESMRTGLALLSDVLAEAIVQFGAEGVGPIYKIHCPMAFNNRGANWLQGDADVRNPYFGKAMPKCGEVVGTVGPQASPQAGEHRHE